MTAGRFALCLFVAQIGMMAVGAFQGYLCQQPGAAGDAGRLNSLRGMVSMVLVNLLWAIYTYRSTR